MQETPEQVVQKMKERVKHLKEEKEKERKVSLKFKNRNILGRSRKIVRKVF